MAQSIPDLVAIKDQSPEQNAVSIFTSRHNPLRMGNAADIGYGGCALAFAVNAATTTVASEQCRLYSALGHFLSASKTDRPLRASVTRTRDTKSFTTRAVTVTQDLDDGSARVILSLNLDYHRVEPASLLTYSVQPSSLASSPPTSGEPRDLLKTMEQLPGSNPGLLRAFQTAFAPALKFFESSTVPESIATQNMYGVLKKAPTSQDHLATSEKASFDWARSRAPLQQYSDHISTMAFHLDGGLSFIPLTHSHMFLQDAAACSSLDFALRFFENDLDFNKWHFREIKTVCGGSGRTYTTSRLFDETGKLVAEMSQQSILRPHRVSKV